MAFFHQDFCHQNKRFCFSTFSVARTKNRSSRPEVFCERGVLRIFTKLTGKHLCQSLFFNKVAGLRCFPVNFMKFLRTPLLQNTSGRLLLLFYKLKHNIWHVEHNKIYYNGDANLSVLKFDYEILKTPNRNISKFLKQ